MATVGAVILAAGGSFRFGAPKQLVKLEGQALIQRAVTAAVEAGCRPLVVVTGSDAEQVAAVLKDQSVVMAENAQWPEGIGSSIRSGITCLLDIGPDTNGIVLMVCDQPLVTSQIITSLIQRWRESGQPIVASGYSDTLGVPALFDRSCFDELLRLKGDTGAKSIILKDKGRVACLPFSEGAIDIDTAEDLAAAVQSAPESQG
jgi:molybdenum cofactor cytidylyltransferase